MRMWMRDAQERQAQERTAWSRVALQELREIEEHRPEREHGHCQWRTIEVMECSSSAGDGPVGSRLNEVFIVNELVHFCKGQLDVLGKERGGAYLKRCFDLWRSTYSEKVVREARRLMMKHWTEMKHGI